MTPAAPANGAAVSTSAPRVKTARPPPSPTPPPRATPSRRLLPTTKRTAQPEATAARSRPTGQARTRPDATVWLRNFLAVFPCPTLIEPKRARLSAAQAAQIARPFCRPAAKPTFNRSHVDMNDIAPASTAWTEQGQHPRPARQCSRYHHIQHAGLHPNQRQNGWLSNPVRLKASAHQRRPRLQRRTGLKIQRCRFRVPPAPP